MQHDDGADSEAHLAPVIDLFGGRRSQARQSRDAAPSSSAHDSAPAGTADPAATSWASARPVDRPREIDPIEAVKALTAQITAEAEAKEEARRRRAAEQTRRRPTDEPRDSAPPTHLPSATMQTGNDGWWVDDGSDTSVIEGDEQVPAVQAPAASPSITSDARPTPTTRERVPTPTRATAAAQSRWSGPDDDDATEAETPRLPIEEASTWALSRKGLSVSEMRAKLLDKGYLSEHIEAELHRLLSARYLDDARLAEEIVRVEFERKGKGRAIVTGELRRRGIDPDDYTAALDDIDSELELERAADIAYRKMASSHSLDARTAERRLSALLARRGFSGELARAAIARANERIANGE